MKQLINYINDCLGALPPGVDYANPMNTICMGNPVLPTDTTVGSGDLLSFIKKRKRKKQKRKINI